jgi:DNA-binding PadR family transcriptional regulator
MRNKQHHRITRIRRPEEGFGFGHKRRFMRGGEPDGMSPSHGRGGPRGGPGGRRRMFDGEALRLLALHHINEGAAHGYDIIRAFEERTKGAYAPSPGIIYPLLSLLEDSGHITDAGGEGKRRSYQLTDEGRAELTAKSDVLTAALARLDALAQQAERVDPAPVRRAMGNLKAALMARLSSGEISQDSLNAIVDAVDAAARQIERTK